MQTVSPEGGKAAVWGGAMALFSAGELLNPVDYINEDYRVRGSKSEGEVRGVGKLQLQWLQ